MKARDGLCIPPTLSETNLRESAPLLSTENGNWNGTRRLVYQVVVGPA